MRFNTICKQGRLQVTDDHYIQIVSLFGGQPIWQEPAQSVRGFDMKPGMMMMSVGIVVHATQDHIVETITKTDFGTLLAIFPGIPVAEVAVLVQQPPVYPMQPQYQPPQPQYLPPQVPMQPPMYQPQYIPQPAPVPQMETTVKSYRTAPEYQRDLKKMQRQGWSVQSSLDHHRDRSLAYKMIVPFGVFSGGTGEIVVTYQRQKQ